MKKLVVAAALLSIAICLPGAQAASAQDLSVSPPNILMLPPPRPPPPPPRMDIPKVPKMDEIPSRPRAPLARRGSYGDRVTQCIHEGAAAGLGPNERAAYSRVCADSR